MLVIIERIRRWGIPGLALGLVLTGVPAFADDLDTKRELSVAAQSLDAALRALAKQADLQILYSPSLVDGRTAPKIAGQLSVREALQKMLAASDLEAVEERPGVVVVRQRVKAPDPPPRETQSVPKPPASPVVDRDSQLEEIVVTSQRRTENLQDVPASITAFNGDILERRNTTEAAQYLALVPNVSFTEDGQSGARGLTISIRGVSNNNVSKFGPTVQSTGAYLDDFSIAANASGTINPPLQDLERLEVLRGPQGTYFGRNSEGGALNLVTKKPTANLEGSVSVDGQAYDTRGAQYSVGGVINVPVTDSLWVRGVGYYEDNTGIVKNIVPGGGDSGHVERMGRLAVRWLPSDQTTVDVLGSIDNYHQGIDETVPSGVFDLDTASTFFVPLGGVTKAINDGEGFWPQNQSRVAQTAIGQHTDNNVYLGVLNIEHHFSDVATLKSISGVMKSRMQRVFEDSGVAEDLLRDYEERDGRSWSSELRQEFKWQRVDWVVGGLVADDTLSKVPLAGGYGGGLGYVTGATTAVSLVPSLLPSPGGGNSALGPIVGPNIVDFGVTGSLPPLFPIPLGPNFTAPLTSLTPDGKGPLCLTCNTSVNDLKSWALFSDVTAHASSRVDLTLGVRYTHDDINNRYQAYDLFRVAQPRVLGVASYNDVSPRVSVTYAFDPDVKAYATVSRGYKAGGFSLNNQTTAATAPAEQYKPEKVWNYEVGLKSTLLDDRLRVNISAFQMEWTDLQLQSFFFSTPGDLTSFINKTINIGKARSQGVEAEVAALIAPGFTITGSMGYLDTRITSHDSAFLSGSQVVSLYGQPLPRSPKWTIVVAPEYKWEWYSHHPYVSADWSFHSGQFSSIEDVTYLQTSNQPIYVVAGVPSSGQVGTVPDRSSGFPFRSPDYHLVNLSVGDQWTPSLDMRFYVANLFDRIYYTGTGDDFGLSGIRLRPHPRYFGLSVTKRF